MSGQLAKLRASQAEEDCSVVDAPRRSLGDFSAGETKEYARMPLRGSACKPFSNTGDHRGMWDRKNRKSSDLRSCVSTAAQSDARCRFASAKASKWSTRLSMVTFTIAGGGSITGAAESAAARAGSAERGTRM